VERYATCYLQRTSPLSGWKLLVIGDGLVYPKPGLSFCLFFFFFPQPFLRFSDRFHSHAKNRFPEVAELLSVCWLEIRGKINTRTLSPATLYTSYLVFKVTAGSYGFENQPVEVAVGVVGSEGHKRSVFLDAERGRRLRYQIVPRGVGLFNRSRMMGFQAPQPREEEEEEEEEEELSTQKLRRLLSNDYVVEQ